MDGDSGDHAGASMLHCSFSWNFLFVFEHGAIVHPSRLRHSKTARVRSSIFRMLLEEDLAYCHMRQVWRMDPSGVESAARSWVSNPEGLPVSSAAK